MNEKSFADKIAELCYEKFSAVPKQGKPNKHQWTLLAGIVKVEGWHAEEVTSQLSMEVVSLGTGSKCIGQGKLSPLGDILNDGHAEVMSRRGLLRYLYEQIDLHYTDKSDIFEFSGAGKDKKCRLKSSVSFHFFTSHTPCGDASIFPKKIFYDEEFGCCLEKAAPDLPEMSQISCVNHSDDYMKTKVNCGKRQGDSLCPELDEKQIKLDEDAVKKSVVVNEGSLNGEREAEDMYRTGAKCLKAEEKQDPYLPGTGYHVVGPVRTKPGRGDPTLSVSCSDKLARWNAVGIQGALLSLFLDAPIYFQSVVVAGGCPFSEEALHRALKGRVIEHSHVLEAPYSVGNPLLLQATLQFSGARTVENDKNPCPSSIVWCKVKQRPLEVAVGGKREGVTKKAACMPAGRLLICKRELFKTFLEIFWKKRVQLPDCTRDDSAGTHDSYLVYKQTAQQYQNAWGKIRSAAFPAWHSKPTELLEFVLENERPST